MPVLPGTEQTEMKRHVRPPGSTGAYASEDKDSRVGLTSGVFGVQNASRLFHVHIAQPGDNPLHTLRNLTTASGGVREGSLFPWNEGDLVCGYFTIEQCRTSTYYLVKAHYVPRHIYAISPESTVWDVEVGTALETEHVLVDAGGKGVGTPTYRETSINNEAADFYADSERQVRSLYIKDHVIPLTANLPRHLEGMDRDKPVGTITATKTIPRWNTSAIAAATRYTNYLNDGIFSVNSLFGYLTLVTESRLMKFQGVRVGRASSQGKSTTTEVACQVTCVFKFNADGFDEIRPHKFKFSNGEEAPIRWNSPTLLAKAQARDLFPGRPEFGPLVPSSTQQGDVVMERFVRYPMYVNFTGLLESFK